MGSCGSPGPLHLLVDSTGIKICGEGQWKVKKHGAENPRRALLNACALPQ